MVLPSSSALSCTFSSESSARRSFAASSWTDSADDVEQELIGRTTLDTLPNLEESGLLARYAQCLADGAPVVLTDFSYFNAIIDDARR